MAVIPLHRMKEFGGGGGGGASISVNIGSLGGGVLDMPPHVLGRLIGDEVARQLRTSGGLRGTVRRVARGGL